MRFPSHAAFVNPLTCRYGRKMHIHPLITDSATLANLCARLSTADFVCVDTEFMRENTFWPELCLIQIADENEAAAIDPMAPGLDMKPLLDLMTENQDVLKVFHAGGQDLEIIYNLTGKTPYPLFDTQVAVVALAMEPARKLDRSSDIGGAKLCASVRAISVHYLFPNCRRSARGG